MACDKELLPSNLLSQLVTGAVGPEGPQGPTGPTGPQGPSGSSSLTSPDGSISINGSSIDVQRPGVWSVVSRNDTPSNSPTYDASTTYPEYALLRARQFRSYKYSDGQGGTVDAKEIHMEGIIGVNFSDASSELLIGTAPSGMNPKFDTEFICAGKGPNLLSAKVKIRQNGQIFAQPVSNSITGSALSRAIVINIRYEA